MKTTLHVDTGWEMRGGQWQALYLLERLQGATLTVPEKSPLFAELLKLNDPEVRRLVQTLAQAAQKPLEQAPLIDEFVGAGQASAPARAPLERANGIAMLPRSK